MPVPGFFLHHGRGNEVYEPSLPSLLDQKGGQSCYLLVQSLFP